MTDFLSSAEHKRHFKECFFPNISVWCCSLSYWLSLFGQKTNLQFIFVIFVWEDMRVNYDNFSLGLTGLRDDVVNDGF